MSDKHKLEMVPVAPSAGRGVCSCGWKSNVSDDGRMYDSNFYSSDDIRRDWESHVREVEPEAFDLDAFNKVFEEYNLPECSDCRNQQEVLNTVRFVMHCHKRLHRKLGDVQKAIGVKI